MFCDFCLGGGVPAALTLGVDLDFLFYCLVDFVLGFCFLVCFSSLFDLFCFDFGEFGCLCFGCGFLLV